MSDSSSNEINLLDQVECAILFEPLEIFPNSDGKYGTYRSSTDGSTYSRQAFYIDTKFMGEGPPPAVSQEFLKGLPSCCGYYFIDPFTRQEFGFTRQDFGTKKPDASLAKEVKPLSSWYEANRTPEEIEAIKITEQIAIKVREEEQRRQREQRELKLQSFVADLSEIKTRFEQNNQHLAATSCHDIIKKTKQYTSSGIYYDKEILIDLLKEQQTGILAQHRGCKQIIANILIALTGIGLFVLAARYATRGCGFFETNSCKKLAEMEKAISDLQKPSTVSSTVY